MIVAENRSSLGESPSDILDEGGAEETVVAAPPIPSIFLARDRLRSRDSLWRSDPRLDLDFKLAESDERRFGVKKISLREVEESSEGELGVVGGSDGRPCGCALGVAGSPSAAPKKPSIEGRRGRAL